MNQNLKMEKKLEGLIAIVTGGGSGIGAGVSKSLPAAGATVVVNYPVASNKEMADKVVNEIKGEGNTLNRAGFIIQSVSTFQ